MVDLVERIDLPNVGLLWHPTVFERSFALEQFQIQRHLIRHVHLQNRNENGSFASLEAGVIPWKEILNQLNVDTTIEFVPSGVCPLENFDAERCLGDAKREATYVRSIVSNPA
jgi:sugar phosphate isomerase/epimerase